MTRADDCGPEHSGTATMTVLVPDEPSSKSSGRAVISEVTIAAVCPQCRGPRGKALRHSRTVDGMHYCVDRWSNQCGHVDYYAAVLAEARATASRR